MKKGAPNRGTLRSLILGSGVLTVMSLLYFVQP